MDQIEKLNYLTADKWLTLNKIISFRKQYLMPCNNVQRNEFRLVQIVTNKQFLYESLIIIIYV